jgi:hypothetical protein
VIAKDLVEISQFIINTIIIEEAGNRACWRAPRTKFMSRVTNVAAYAPLEGRTGMM